MKTPTTRATAPAFWLQALLSLALSLVLAALPLEAGATAFRRGDSNADGRVDISDAVNILSFLFLSQPKGGCDDAMDSNDDGVVDISDSISLLAFLFTGGREVPPPHRECGEDPTGDSLTCYAYPPCHLAFSEADLDTFLASRLSAAYCLPAGTTRLEAGNLRLAVCPAGAAGPCGLAGKPGCPMELKSMNGRIELDGTERSVHIHFEGEMPGTPIAFVDPALDPRTCTADIRFSFDSVVSLVANEGPDGTLDLAGLGDPVIENVNLSLIAEGDDAEGDDPCLELQALRDSLADDLAGRLAESLGALVRDLRAELAGQVLEGAPIEQSFAFGGIAYLAEIESLSIVDAEYPSEPLAQYKTGTVPADRGSYVQRLAKKGSILFVAHGIEGVQLLDVSDPYNPREVDEIPPSTDYSARFVLAEGDRLYVTEEKTVLFNAVLLLRIFDISTPSAPRLLGTKPVGSGYGGMTETIGAGHIAVRLSGEIRIFEVRDPAAVRLVSSIPGEGVVGMLAKDQKLYVMREPLTSPPRAENEFAVWNVGDPANPFRQGIIPKLRGVSFLMNLSMTVRGGRRYVLGGLSVNAWIDQVAVIEVTDPASPALIRSVDLLHEDGWPLRPLDLDAAGGKLFVSGTRILGGPPWEDYHEAILDINDPPNARLESITQVPPADPILERSLVLRGHMYINEGKSLVVVRAAAPTRLVKRQPMGSEIVQLELDQNWYAPHLFVVLQSGAIKVLDIARPSALAEVASLAPSAGYTARQVKVLRDRVYVTESSGSSWKLRIFSTTSMPPAPLGEYDLGQIPGADSIGGQIRSLGSSVIAVDIPGVQIQILDAADPASVRFLSSFMYPANGGMVARGSLLYVSSVSNWVADFQVWDLSGPLFPRPLGRIPNLNNRLPYATSITTVQGKLAGREYVFLGMTDGGAREELGVIDVTDPASPKLKRIVRLQSPTGDVVPYDLDIVKGELHVSGWNMPAPPQGQPIRYRYWHFRYDLSDPENPVLAGGPSEIPSVFVVSS